MTLTDTEKVEFIHKISKNIRHGRRTFFDHLLKTSGIVEKLCEDIGITESRVVTKIKVSTKLKSTALNSKISARR